MRKLFNFPIALTIILFVFSSCQNDDNNILDESSHLDNEEFIFMYKGEKYISKQEIIGDEVIFLDSKVRQKAQELASNKSLISFVHSNGLIEYFDNEEDFNKNLPNIKDYAEKLNSSTRATLPPRKDVYKAQARVFENSKLKKKSITMQISSQGNRRVYYDIDALTAAGLRFKISSLDIDCWTREFNPGSSTIASRTIFLILYKHYPDGTVHSIRFFVDDITTHVHVHYLSSCPLYPGSSRNWNDACDAVEFRYEY